MLKKSVGTMVIVGLLSSLTLSACSLLPVQNNDITPSSADTKMNPSEKTGDTSKSGTVTETEGRFYLQGSGPTPQEIDSYTVDLKSYVGQTVTVTGQYSGDTLFVGSIK